jgi:N-acetylglucosaminyltransferase
VTVSAIVNVALLIACFTYLLTVGPYLVLQVAFAERTRRGRVESPDQDWTPSVDVIVPCYNEDPRTLAACLDSIGAQDYAGEIRVHIVDDGSPNRAELDAVYVEYSQRPGHRLILLPANRGKRHAQVEAITRSGGELVIAVDSDTMIRPDGFRRLVAGLRDPRVGAAMGEMLAANAGTNWLTRLIDMRYWYACNQERAAQSLFGAVLCCCGPFSVYRRSVLEGVLDDYVNQTFRMRRSSYGEDRHLTNLVLRSGRRTIYVPAAKAVTMVPERLRPFLRQQLRWNRCTYRDMVGIIRRLPALGAYLALDAFAQIFAPAWLALSVLLLLLHSILAGTGGLAWYGIGAAAVALAYCVYGVCRTRDLRFLSFALYGLLHLGLLVPVRIRALFTLTDDRWGARGVTS